HAHDDIIDPAKIARGEADRETENYTDRGDRAADDQRNPATIYRSTEHAASEIVGAEGIQGRRRAKPVGRTDGKGITYQKRRHDGGERQAAEQQQSDRHSPIEAHHRRILGSNRPQARSTKRLMRTQTPANTSVTPWITG